MANEEKSAQLGMPYGTANAKLRKMILYHLIKKYNEDTCYRCNSKIENLDDLSIEHKKPWLGISTELFWDINNISFSHLSCNSSASRRPWRKVGPKGTLWCTFGKHYVEITRFYKMPSKRRGYSDNCSPCDIRIVDIRRRKKGLRPKELKFKKGSKYDGR